MKRLIYWASFVAFAAATHAGVSTLALQIPDLYPTREMTERVQHLVFLEAAIAFSVMLLCYLAARRVHR